MATIEIREATPEDGGGCAAVYAPYVHDTAITFELDPPPAAEMSRRIAAALSTHAWVVTEERGRVVGYAYAGPYKSPLVAADGPPTELS